MHEQIGLRCPRCKKLLTAEFVVGVNFVPRDKESGYFPSRDTYLAPGNMECPNCEECIKYYGDATLLSIKRRED